MSKVGGADWSPDNLKGWMKDKDGTGVAKIVLKLPAGNYEYKVAVNESWTENYGAGGAAGGDNIKLAVPADNTEVTFTYNDTTHQITDSINNPAQPGIDGNILWDGLRHDSRDPLYRAPFGAVTKGTEVRLRFRTTAGDVEGVGVRVADLLGGGATTYRMAKVATVPGAPFGYDFWEAKFKAPEKLTVLGYTFGAVDGAKIVYYEDDAAQDGGVGQPYNAPANQPYNIYVYDAAFTTPEWAKNAVIYQIFPDRFRNGNAANDPTAAKWFYPAERGHAWPDHAVEHHRARPRAEQPGQPVVQHLQQHLLRRRPAGRARQAGLSPVVRRQHDLLQPDLRLAVEPSLRRRRLSAPLIRPWAIWRSSSSWTKRPKSAA